MMIVYAFNRSARAYEEKRIQEKKREGLRKSSRRARVDFD